MSTHNYLVSVFVDGKHINSYFSVCLDDLVTIRALHKGCEVSIFDLQDFTTLSKEQVENEIKKSGERWKKSLERRPEKPVVRPSAQKKPKKKKSKKYWERQVMCVETGQVFPTIRDCSEKTGIPYMTISNCIRRKNATRGVHFVNYNDVKK